MRLRDGQARPRLLAHTSVNPDQAGATIIGKGVQAIVVASKCH